MFKNGAILAFSGIVGNTKESWDKASFSISP